ncbi:MAG TPA: NAD(P)-dependent oxidoreductase [Polyangiaceae bacterium]
MRVLVAGRLPKNSLEEIQSLGVELVYQPALLPPELPAALAGVNVLVVRGLMVDAAAIAAGDALNLIIRAGSGVGLIDVSAASARGIYVANTPGKNASAVAELTMTLIGCLDRRVPDACSSLRQGSWEKEEYAQALGLRGRRLGIAGLGYVGRYVASLAKAYGMCVHAWSRSLNPARAAELGIGLCPNLTSLAERSDIFTVHLDATERTRGVISRRILEALPTGAIFVNTAGASLVDYEALIDVARRKKIRVGLDVLPDEPMQRNAQYSHPIVELPLLIATPHIGASTDEAQAAIANETVHVLRSFLTKGEVPNVVNISATSWARYQLVVRHIEKTGALAHVLTVLKRHGIHVQELDNTVFEGGKAACAKIRVESRPSDGCLTEIMAFSSEILHVDLVSLPNLA